MQLRTIGKKNKIKKKFCVKKSEVSKDSRCLNPETFHLFVIYKFGRNFYNDLVNINGRYSFPTSE